MNRRSFIRGAVIAASTPATIGIVAYDPLVAAIRRYREGVAEFAAIPDSEINAKNENELIQATYGPAQDFLSENIVPATSLAGVREALRFMLDERAFDCVMSEKVAQSALEYLETQAA